MAKQCVAIFYDTETPWGKMVERVELVPENISSEQYCNNHIESIDMADVYEVEIENDDWYNIIDTEECNVIVTVCPLEQSK